MTELKRSVTAFGVHLLKRDALLLQVTLNGRDCPLQIFGLQIGEVNRPPVEDGACSEKVARQGQRSGGGKRSMVGNEAKHITVHLTDHGVIGFTEAGSLRCDLCEHSSQVRR